MTQMYQLSNTMPVHTDSHVAVHMGDGAPVPHNAYQVDGADTYTDNGDMASETDNRWYDNNHQKIKASHQMHPTPDRVNAHIINAATGYPFFEDSFRVGSNRELELYKVRYVAGKGKSATLFYPDQETFERVTNNTKYNR